jgi:hypothetical protein
VWSEPLFDTERWRMREQKDFMISSWKLILEKGGTLKTFRGIQRRV